MDKKGTSQKKKKKAGKHVFKKLIFTILIIALTISVAIGGVVLAMVKTAPSLNINEFLKLDEITVLLDDSGKLMDEYVISQRRINVPISDVPVNLQEAFISIEDFRFATHPGIDIKRLAGSIFNDIKIKITGSGQSLQGASTITQQLVKYRVFLEDSIENRTSIKRKVQEIYLSLQIEKVLTKSQILETYMNTIFLGGNAHGIEAASQQYFNKSVENLTLKQSAFIASAAQNPSVSYSMATKSFDTKTAFDSARTKAVLANMYKYNKISKVQFDSAMAEKLTFSFAKKDANKMNYEFFSRPALLQVTNDLMKKYKISQKEASSMLMYDGVKIYTTMDRNMQNTSQSLIDAPMNSSQEKLQASCVIMDYHTGEVKTIIGGRNVKVPGSYNRAAYDDSFLRAPGSSIKPLTVYSPAINTKIATASTVIEDSPVSASIGYNPKNSPDIYRGYLTLRDCLKYSVNVAAVKIENMIGIKTGVSYGEKFGLQLDNVDKISQSAMALGQLNTGTNPLTMAAAYGVFGNSGNRTTPRLYTKVVDRTGKVLLDTKPETTPVLSPQSAYIMYDLLSGPVGPGGTGTNAVFSDMPVRGKTGTSSNSKDLWFVGLTPYYSAAVWIGTDKADKIEGLGSNDAAQLWGKVMKSAHTSLPVKNVDMPSGISSLSVSKDSGNIPTDLTIADPRGDRVYSELFIDGTQPTTLDSIHVSAKVTRDANGNYVLASEYTPIWKIETRVFIKRDYVPNAYLEDSAFVLPTAVDTSSGSFSAPSVVTPNIPSTTPEITPPVTTPKTNEGNNTTNGGGQLNPNTPINNTYPNQNNDTTTHKTR
ncbi:PBP1A family penicillin-binding protein [Clostridium estertheticum]|uniref:peptidoglycan glycosyltransferase n=1 Tax=Clostridium estertheticum TaxID=238834 RepID=A0AA47I833_9CLOT|nr:PBP1A family penicillin-binding protein [Clostridium estertheticum]MBU3154782.1 PBP1A family penicillin-binding protein [Clostridium estertheticum]MBU3198919.1 PBP1A family penicillin-binding protein [Clostridium estertheticum]WAG61640.1 PBP1A family penicillin-binding protein [Clostridium estertheticum]WAG64230.1 PBP1A family penicillin-binding protein [Clostridium estertheticum]